VWIEEEAFSWVLGPGLLMNRYEDVVVFEDRQTGMIPLTDRQILAIA
jgi:hypothetical protein